MSSNICTKNLKIKQPTGQLTAKKISNEITSKKTHKHKKMFSKINSGLLSFRTNFNIPKAILLAANQKMQNTLKSRHPINL